MVSNWNSTSIKLSCETDFFFSVDSLAITKMDRLAITQHMKIIKTCYKDGDFATATYRSLRQDYGLHPSTMQAIGKIVK